MRAEGGFPYTLSDTNIAKVYGDLAYPDFNEIFKNKGEIVREQYGQTIKVKLRVLTENGTTRVKREVTEDMRHKKAGLDLKLRVNRALPEKDHMLDTVEGQMKNFQDEFGKNHDQLAEIFCAVSGQVHKVREYLTLER